MKFRCEFCGASQWRGVFPESSRFLRWVVIHGIALGVCGIATKLLFTHFGYTTTGWLNGPASLGVCAVLMFGFYAVAIIIEACVVVGRRCRECGVRGLRPDLGKKNEPGGE